MKRFRGKRIHPKLLPAGWKNKVFYICVALWHMFEGSGSTKIILKAVYGTKGICLGVHEVPTATLIYKLLTNIISVQVPHLSPSSFLTFNYHPHNISTSISSSPHFNCLVLTPHFPIHPLLSPHFSYQAPNFT